MLSCKDFLHALNDYLDETEDAALKSEVEQHVTACPNCWVIFDTTRKTVQIYQGCEPYPLSERLRNRLQEALRKHCAESPTKHE